MKVVSYLRVSTEQQLDGFGLDVQAETIQAWASRHGYELTQTFKDEGLSGTLDAQERPGLASALDAIKQGEADGIVVARLDRLARNLGVQEAVFALVWKHGGRVFSADIGEVLQDDPDDPMRTAMRQMVGVFAQLERGMISARLKAGRRMKASQGGYIGGTHRYGFRRDASARDLVADEREQGAIDRILELRSAGMTLQDIAAVLDTEGIRPRRADRWHHYSVSRIIKRAQVATCR